MNRVKEFLKALRLPLAILLIASILHDGFIVWGHTDRAAYFDTAYGASVVAVFVLSGWTVVRRRIGGVPYVVYGALLIWMVTFLLYYAFLAMSGDLIDPHYPKAITLFAYTLSELLFLVSGIALSLVGASLAFGYEHIAGRRRHED